MTSGTAATEQDTWSVSGTVQHLYLMDAEAGYALPEAVAAAAAAAQVTAG